MVEFKLPDLGEGIHEAEVLVWHVELGGEVGLDEPLVDVETDKATVTIPSPVAGTLRERVGEPGETIHVDQVIAVLEKAGGEAVPAVKRKATPAAASSLEAPPPAAPVVGAAAASLEAPPPAAPVVGAAAAFLEALPHDAPVASATAPVPAAPATRRLARELGVDLSQIPVDGSAGRVTDEAVRAFSEGSSSSARSLSEPGVARSEGSGSGGAVRTGAAGAGIPYYDPEPLPDFEQFGEVERQPLRSIRRKIAKHMVVSNLTAPRVGHSVEVDVTDLEGVRHRYNGAKGDGEARLTLLAFVTKGVAVALGRWPQLNASLDIERGDVVLKKYVNIGLAVAADKGLIVPVLRGADKQTIKGISAEIGRLVQAVRDDSVAVDDLRGGSFTITNIGPLGGVPVGPMINYPEVAILGMGAVEEKPVVRAGEIVVRTILPLVVMFDHRVADGADAARFMADLKRMLSDPGRFLLEV